MSREVMITCAVTGAGDTPGKSALVPVTPAEIAESSLEAAAAGAAAIHIHVRDPETGAASYNGAYFREVVDRIRNRNEDVILNLTGGMGADIMLGDVDPLAFKPGTDCVGPNARIAHVIACGADVGSLDIGTMNFDDVIYATTPTYGRQIAAAYRSNGIRPEIEVFDLGHIELARQFVAENALDAPALFQLCLGVRYGAPATPEAMLAMRNALPPGSLWSAFGIGRNQFPMVAQAVLLGGHVRVGLEDNLYLERGVLASNAQLVERTAQIIAMLGASVMSAASAREMLGLRATNAAPVVSVAE